MTKSTKLSLKSEAEAGKAAAGAAFKAGGKRSSAGAGDHSSASFAGEPLPGGRTSEAKRTDGAVRKGKANAVATPNRSSPLANIEELERERLCLQRLVDLGEHTYGLALDNTVLASHEPDEDVRAKLAAIGNRAGATWIKLYDKEREVRSRLVNRGK